MIADVFAIPICKAVILSAGKGSRLLPLTEHRPKCLLKLAGRTLLDRQIDALEEAGIEEVIVVTGFGDDQVDRTIAARRQGRARVRTLFNPFYHVADNLGSVWMAREEFDGNLLLLNGDTLVTPDLVRQVIENAGQGITVTIDRKPAYDDDDMKVEEVDGRLIHIGKTLSPHQTSAESIGLLAFRAHGARTFIEAVERLMHTPEGTSSWYLRAIEGLADTLPIRTLSIEGHEWAEVDYPQDYKKASALVAEWDRQAGVPRQRTTTAGWTALVLAGERPGGDALAQGLGVPAKALLPLLDEPMLNHVVRSLLATPAIERIAILTQRPEELRTPATEWLQHEKRVSFIQSGDGISASIEAVAGGADAPWPVLVTTADHPLLTPAMVSDFLAQADTPDIAVGAVERETVLGAYPQTKRTWLHFRDGAYSGANLFALTSGKVSIALKLWADVEADRKKVYRLFWRFGPLLALQAIARLISFDGALTKAGRNLGMKVKLVALRAPEAAIDVDKLSDLRLVESILAARGPKLQTRSEARSVPLDVYA